MSSKTPRSIGLLFFSLFLSYGDIMACRFASVLVQQHAHHALHALQVSQLSQNGIERAGLQLGDDLRVYAAAVATWSRSAFE